MYKQVGKRAIDVTLSLLGLILASWLYLLIMIAIEIDDPGPVFFSQKRVGIHKKYFQLYKFRSMKMSTPHDMPTHLLENPEQYKATYVSMGYGRELVTLENAKRIIEENHGVIRRTELAKKLNYSCEYISQIIRAHTGYTFKKYCQKVQLQEAARLLRSTDLSVSKIAASLGYENRTQFYKIFQEEYQLTPSEYRKINH